MKGRRLRIDAVAFLHGEPHVAVECGHTPREKLELLCSLFPQVRRLLYSKKINPKLIAISGASKVLKGNTSFTTSIPAIFRLYLNLKDGDKLQWFTADSATEGTYLIVRKKDKKPLVVKDGRILA